MKGSVLASATSTASADILRMCGSSVPQKQACTTGQPVLQEIFRIVSALQLTSKYDNLLQ